MLANIQDVIERKIRPSLLDHQGDVEILSLEDGILRIRLLGKCSGCPSAQLTTEELIKTEIMEEIPQVKDVVLVQETSPELMEFARKILRHEAWD